MHPIGPRSLNLLLNDGAEEVTGKPDWSVVPHQNDYRFIFVPEGCGTYYDTKEQHFKAGSVILAIPGVCLKGKFQGEKRGTLFVQSFRLLYLNSFDYFTLVPGLACKKIVHSEEITNVASVFFRKESNKSSPFVRYGLFTQLIYLFIDAQSIGSRVPSLNAEDSAEIPFYDSMVAITEYVSDHLLEKDVFQKAIQNSELNEAHARVLFKTVFGRTLHQYIREKQIELSKFYLSRGKSVRETSMLVRFDDEFYFSRIFKKITGISPKQFQMKCPAV